MELTGTEDVKAGATGVSAGAVTVVVIAFSYFWRGIANTAAGVKAAAADGSKVRKVFPVPTEPQTDMAGFPTGVVIFAEGCWVKFNYELGRDTEIPANAS